MHHPIKKHPVKHPLLKRYIKFYWELQVDHLDLDHALVPQRNINLRFNLAETPQFITINQQTSKAEELFFSGLHQQNQNAVLKMNGKADVLGICFQPDGFYPFVKVPLSEFNNQVLGLDTIGLKAFTGLHRQMKETGYTATRLMILENGLIAMLDANYQVPEKVGRLLETINQSENPLQITAFCKQQNIDMRQLERLYKKYVGISALAYHSLNRFHSSMNQLLKGDYDKLSDIAYQNDYYDQMHFIRNFKRFAGTSPKQFLQSQKSILHIGQLT